MRVQTIIEQSDGLPKMAISKWSSLGACVNAKNNGALIWTSYNGHVGVVKFLVEHGADVSANDNEAIRCASFHGHFKVIKFLVEHGADVTRLAMRYASEAGHLQVVKFLVANGADISANDNESIVWASRAGHLEVVKFLVEKGCPMEILTERDRRYVNFCTKFERKRKIAAVNTIGTWWIPICYKLTDEFGELRMAKKSWEKLDC